jgi:hypothetical protein
VKKRVMRYVEFTDFPDMEIVIRQNMGGHVVISITQFWAGKSHSLMFPAKQFNAIIKAVAEAKQEFKDE